MDLVNAAVRLIVVAFVFIGVAFTLAGPKLVTGNNIAAPDRPGVTAPTKNKLTTSTEKSSAKKPKNTG